MTGLEKSFAAELDSWLAAGNIIKWRYEPMRFRLTQTDKKTTYTPDFCVLFPNGTMTFYETKGRWTSASRIKTKLLADQYDEFNVYGVMRKKGEFVYERFSPPEQEQPLNDLAALMELE